MPAVHRIGDANNGGGVLTSTPQDFVRVESKLVAVNGAQGTTHGSGDDTHTAGSWQTAHGSSTVRIAGYAVNRKDDVDSCGHARAAGSPSVKVGG